MGEADRGAHSGPGRAGQHGTRRAVAWSANLDLRDAQREDSAGQGASVVVRLHRHIPRVRVLDAQRGGGRRWTDQQPIGSATPIRGLSLQLVDENDKTKQAAVT